MLNLSVHHAALDRNVKHRMVMLSVLVLELAVGKLSVFMGQNFKFYLQNLLRFKNHFCIKFSVFYFSLRVLLNTIALYLLC